ncbi:MAG: WD40 repeat domain-containing protein [Chloroflexi bacterium]|nr:WD40 repeat domain-containing protein [Chloroflexota bacterium]
MAEINLSGGEDQIFDALAISSDGQLLAAAGGGTLRVWDTGTWEAWEPKPTHDDTVGILKLTDDDTRLLISSGTAVGRWSLLDRRLTHGEQLEPYSSRHLCIIREGDISLDSSLLMTGDDCGQYRAWDLAAGTEIYIPQLHKAQNRIPVTVMQFSPDGRVLFVGSYAGFGMLFVHQPE